MPSPTTESVVEALNDVVRSGSNLMKVLRVLLRAELLTGEWLTTREIAERANIPTEAVGSRIRELRVEGFNIKRNKRPGGGRVWEYRVFYAAQGN
jgi:DNA-binding Lrp family transcriptional regulator